MVPRILYILYAAIGITLLLSHPTPAYAQDIPCWDSWEPTCTVTVAAFGAELLRGGLDLIPTPHTDICRMTPSTGNGAGINIRALPDIESDVIGDIGLEDYREVTALSPNWVQTKTRDGRTGFVAAGMAALVGPCGDVPRFVVTQ